MKKDKLLLKSGIVFATVILLGSLESATAQGNLVVNGSFDIGFSGWEASNVAGIGYDSQKGNPGGCFDLFGNQNPATISQTINGLTPGISYIVSGDYQSQEASNGNGLGVSIDDSWHFFGGSISAWESFSFIYTANSSSVDLSLSSRLNGTGNNYRVDNISLAAVPEPNSLFLVGIGGIGGLLWLRRKGSAC